MKTLDQMVPKFAGMKAYEDSLESDNEPLASTSAVTDDPMPSLVTSSGQKRRAIVVTETDPKLRQQSNEKRLKSLRDRQEFDRHQQSVVKEAIINSGQRVNKRIVFNDNLLAFEDKSTADLQTFDGKLDVFINKERLKVSDDNKRQKRQLFDSDSDDSVDGGDREDLKDFEDEFTKKLNDKNAGKLIELNSRFAHDSRFRIDERFLDQLDDNDKDMDPLINEKQNNMNILEEVLGKRLTPIVRPNDRSNEKSRHSLPDNNSLFAPRFDPKSDKSLAYEVNTRSADKRSKKVSFDKLVVDKLDDKGPEVSKEVYYEVSNDLKESLAKKDGEEFSLTQMFGSNSGSDNSRKDLITDDKTVTFDKLDTNRKQFGVSRNPFKYDSSSSDDEEDSDDNDSEIVVKTGDINSGQKFLPPKPLPDSFKFFFVPNDRRLTEDVFWDKELVAKARNSYKDRQVMLMRAIRVRKKSAIKNKKSDQKHWLKSKNNPNFRKPFNRSSKQI